MFSLQTGLSLSLSLQSIGQLAQSLSCTHDTQHGRTRHDTRTLSIRWEWNINPWKLPLIYKYICVYGMYGCKYAPMCPEPSSGIRNCRQKNRIHSSITWKYFPLSRLNIIKDKHNWRFPAAKERANRHEGCWRCVSQNSNSLAKIHIHTKTKKKQLEKGRVIREIIGNAHIHTHVHTHTLMLRLHCEQGCSMRRMSMEFGVRGLLMHSLGNRGQIYCLFSD